MGQEQSAAFYDSRLDRVGLPYEDSPWKAIYDAVVGYLPQDRSTSIIDVGCGTGRCVEAARRAGYTHVRGFDFSPVRIEEARRYVPGYAFDVLDVFSEEAAKLIEAADAVIVTEVLEHIEADREVLRAVSPGALVLFSVPNFDSAGHVRTFADIGAVRDRYDDLLDITDETVIPKPTRPDKVTFVCRATRHAQ